MQTITQLVDKFIAGLTTIVENDVRKRVLAFVGAAEPVALFPEGAERERIHRDVAGKAKRALATAKREEQRKKWREEKRRQTAKKKGTKT